MLNRFRFQLELEIDRDGVPGAMDSPKDIIAILNSILEGTGYSPTLKVVKCEEFRKSFVDGKYTNTPEPRAIIRDRTQEFEA